MREQALRVNVCVAAAAAVVVADGLNLGLARARAKLAWHARRFATTAQDEACLHVAVIMPRQRQRRGRQLQSERVTGRYLAGYLPT